jgi:hypothetical protein
MTASAYPAIAASIAALLAAIGVNVSDSFWQFVIEIIAMLFAIAGIVTGFIRAKQ